MKVPFPCRPTAVVSSFSNIDPGLLVERRPGIKAMTYDIDGVLIDYDGSYDSLPDRHLEVIRQANAIGLVQALISNTGSGPRAERSEALARYLQQAAGLEDLPVINSGMPGCRKKPDKSMFLKAAEVLGVEPLEVCHSGDQMLKDVMGANRAGYGATILTARFGTGDHAGVRFAQRPLEAGLRQMLDLPVSQGDFPRTF